MAEIGNGYAWFKFDIEGWLSSPDILNMKTTEEGIYIRLLATQGRDGSLPTPADDIAKKSGLDVRGIRKWLKKYGHMFPVLDLSSEALVTVLHPCSKHEASPQRSCDKCVAHLQQVCSMSAASVLQGGRRRANPKLWNLQVESGKLKGLPLLEENREEIELDTEADKTTARMTMRRTILVGKVGA